MVPVCVAGGHDSRRLEGIIMMIIVFVVGFALGLIWGAGLWDMIKTERPGKEDF